MGGTRSMVGEDWYRYLAATNQGIVEARACIEKQKGRIDESKQKGRNTADLVARLGSLEDTLQQLTVRRERILKRVRTYPLPVDDDRGAVIVLANPDGTDQLKNRVDRIRCPAIEGLARDTVHMLHQSLVGIARMQMSIERA